MSFAKEARPSSTPPTRPSRNRRRNTTLLPATYTNDLYTTNLHRRLDSYEDDNHAAHEVSLVNDSNDEEFTPGLEDPAHTPVDDIEVTPTASSSSKRRRSSRGRAAKRQKTTTSDDTNLVSTKGKRKQKKSLRRFNMSTLTALEIDAAEQERPTWLPRLSEIEATVSQEEIRRISRKWCSVCGFEAPYRCVRCGMLFCSLKCGKLHDETRCLKFTI